jgi:hypothetical protein
VYVSGLCEGVGCVTEAYALMVDDLDDDCELAGERAFGEHCDAADLDEAPVAGCHLRVAHFAGDCWVCGAVLEHSLPR